MPTLVPIIVDGARMLVEVSSSGEAEVALGDALNLDGFLDTVETLAGAIVRRLKNAAPDKAVVEFGVEIGLEAGTLTTLLVKGTGKGNLKITLEWSRT
jgi:hypothetical protein